MNKSDIVKEIGQPGLPNKDVEFIVSRTFELMGEALTRGERVMVHGFGVLHTKTRQARKGRNPKTGEAIHIPTRRSLLFRPSRSLKERVNARSDGGSGE